MSIRSIQTTFYQGRTVVKVNTAVHANSAVLRCVDHMQLNHYSATAAEVFDNQSGVLHAVIHRSVTGRITIIYKREVKEGM